MCLIYDKIRSKSVIIDPKEYEKMNESSSRFHPMRPKRCAVRIGFEPVFRHRSVSLPLACRPPTTAACDWRKAGSRNPSLPCSAAPPVGPREKEPNDGSRRVFPSASKFVKPRPTRSGRPWGALRGNRANHRLCTVRNRFSRFVLDSYRGKKMG